MIANIDIYVDASFGNGWLRRGAGVGLYFGRDNKNNSSITVLGNDTYVMDNQGAEAIAIYIALALTDNIRKVIIYSDNQHSVTSLSIRRKEFEKNKWITTKNKPVAHRNILVPCTRIINSRQSRGFITHIKHVAGHSGNTGNSEADRYAYNAMSTGSKTICSNVFVIALGSTLRNLVASNARLVELYNNLNPPTILQMPVSKKSKGLARIVGQAVSSSSPVDDNLWELKTDVIYDQDKDLCVSSSIADHNEEVNMPEPLSPNIEEKMDYDSLEEEVDAIENIEGDNNLYVDANGQKIEKYLFITCSACGSQILIRYPYNGYKRINNVLDVNSFCTMAFTTCKTCLLLDGLKTPLDTAAEECKTYMERIHIHPSMFEGSRMYNCAETISGHKPTIVTMDKFIKYIPVTDISIICSNKCRGSSVDIENSEVLPYLQFGFLP